MEDRIWQLKTIFVLCVDVVYVAIQSTVVTILVVVAANQPDFLDVFDNVGNYTTKETHYIIAEHWFSMMKIILSISLALYIPVTVLELVACWKMWEAYKPNCLEKMVVKNVSFWRNVKVVSLALYIPRLYGASMSIIMVTGSRIIINLVGIWFGTMCIYEVDYIAASRTITTC